MENSVCKISWKLVENWLRNRRNSFTTVNVNPAIVEGILLFVCNCWFFLPTVTGRNEAIIVELKELFVSKWLARRDTGVLDNRLVRRHTGVQVYSGIYLEHRYAVPAAGTRYLIS